eukprot:TRINITY_DN7223_c0_g1_i1.p1 TRINITY_DN7223_c0_g1~~TRINITY_DN7223_c0_g1_i1.p1  ORF type:complete len:801 (-),score=101.09 TRINITY_DN7223_c0_g1_i1:1299-3701(-)
MSPPLLTCERRMFPTGRTPSTLNPPFQDRRSKRLTLSIPEPAAWCEAPKWCQLEQPYSDLAAELDTLYVELPQATTCESLNSFCRGGESLGSPAATPRSRDPPGERSDSAGSLRVFGSEVVESSNFFGGGAMEESDPEGGPPANITEQDSFFWQDPPAGTLPVTAGALLDMPTGFGPVTAGMAAPPSLTFGHAGRSVPAAPAWRNPPRWEQQAPGPFVSQAPFLVTPPAFPPSLPPLGRDFNLFELLNPQTQRQGGVSQMGDQINLHSIFSSLLGTPPQPDRSADSVANFGINLPGTYDLREGGAEGPPSGAAPDRGAGPSQDALFEEFMRRSNALGVSLASLPRSPSDPPAPNPVAPPRRPQELAALLHFPQLEPHRNMTISDPTLPSFAFPHGLWRREGTLADPPGTLPELLPSPPAPSGGPVPERLSGVPDPPERLSDLPPGVLQRVASAPPLGGATLPTLVAPTDPALESPGVVSTVQLASSDGSPVATSAPAKRPRKRIPKGKTTEGQLEKSPSLKRPQARPPSPIANPVRNPPRDPEDNRPHSAPQNPGESPGAARDPTSMAPKRTFSGWSVQSLDEPGADIGGQGTRRPLKKPRDVPPGGGTISAHSSGGGSAAGSLSETAPPIESGGPKEGDEGITRHRAQNRKDRRRRLNELRAKTCGCTQDWPNDMQELRAKCNEQSLEIRALRNWQNLINRRDSLQTQQIEALRGAVADLTCALDAARAQLARQGALPPPGEGADQPRAAEGGARGPVEARALEGARARGARPREDPSGEGRGGRSSEEESSRGPRSNW